MFVRIQAFAYDLVAVIVANDQLRAILVTDFVNKRGLGMDVVDRPTGGTSPPSSDPEQQLIIIHLNPHHNRQPCRPFSTLKELKLQKRIQPRRLLLGSRKAVEHESSLRIRLPQPPSDNVANQVV